MSSVEVAALVRQAMRDRGMSFEDVAAASGLGIATVHRIAHGRANGTLRTLTALAGALGVSRVAMLRAAGAL